MSDTQLFPPTPEERLADVRTHLADEVEKREKAAESAMSKLYEARQLLETFDEAMKSRAGTGRSVLETAADIVNSGALDTDGLTVTASVSHGQPNCDSCSSSDCNLRQSPGSALMGCDGNGWTARAVEDLLQVFATTSDADLIKSYRSLLDRTTKRETCDKESLRAFDDHCEEMERRGMDLDPASLTKRLREAKAATG